VARTRQALKCSGHRTNGDPCKAYAINGGTVCTAHGGSAPQVKAAAALNVAARKAEGLLAGIIDFDPVTDPIGELQRVAGRAVRLVEVLEPVVADLKRIRYTAQAEQVDGRVVVYERALDRAGKILTDLARLNLDERIARRDEAQARVVGEIVRGALADIGAPPELLEAIRPALAARFRLAEAGKPQPSRLPLALALTAEREG